MSRLFPILKLENNKLNLNLFRVFIDPLFRLLCSIYEFINDTAKKKISLLYRKIFKRFMRLPYRTPNKIISTLIGDFH
jgi:hypothetical protein